MLRRSILVLLFALAPATAWASATPGETCNITGSGGVTCSAASCTLGGTLAAATCSDVGGDDLLSFTGGDVTCSGDIIADTTSGAGLVFGAGATFSCDVTDNSNQMVEIRLGTAGFNAAAADSVVTQGRWLVPAATPTWATSPAAASWFAASKVIPCPVIASTQAVAGSATTGPYEPDCTNGNANHLMVDFDEIASSSSEVGFRFVSASLDALVAGESEACWGQANDLYPVRDAFACYSVAVVNTTEEFVLLDIRQGTADSSYPLARRDFKEAFLAADLAAGARVAEVDDGAAGSVFAADDYYNGRWLAVEDGVEPCGDTDAVPCEIDYAGQVHLGLTFDSADYFASNSQDTLYTIAQVAKSYADNSRVWITYGHLPGETIAFRNPVKFTSATAAATDPADSDVEMPATGTGTSTLSTTTFVALGMDTEISSGSSHDWVWVIDGEDDASCGQGRIWDFGGSDNTSVTHSSRTGGVAACTGAGTPDTTHGYGAPGVTTITGNTFRYNRLRHGGDDDFVAAQGSTITGLVFEGNISEFASGNAVSKSMLDAVSSTVSGIIRRNVCNDCTSRDTAGSMFGGDGTAVIEDATMVASYGPLGSTVPWNATNIKAISNQSPDVAGLGPWQGTGTLTGFVFDQWLAQNDNAASLLMSPGGSSSSTWKRGIVRRSEVRGRTLGIITSDDRLEDVWIDGNIGGAAGEVTDTCPDSPVSTSCIQLNFSANPTGVVLNRVGIRAGAGTCRTLNITGSSLTASGLLLMDQEEVASGCRAIASSEAQIQDMAAEAETPWCFYNNNGVAGSEDVVAAAEDDLPAGSLRGVRPLFLDDARDRQLVLPGTPVAEAGCGPAADTGVSERLWGDYILGTNADCLGCGEWGGLATGGGGPLPRPVRP